MTEGGIVARKGKSEVQSSVGEKGEGKGLKWGGVVGIDEEEWRSVEGSEWEERSEVGHVARAPLASGIIE